MDDLDPQLLEIIACPCVQHAPLAQETIGNAEVLRCTRCLTSFPVRDGIPVLLIDEATEGPGGIGAAIAE